MRETIQEWKNEWIETNGETEELEVLISYSNSDGYIYEGSFANIPEELGEKKVVDCGRIIDSSVHDRVGAYSLKI